FAIVKSTSKTTARSSSIGGEDSRAPAAEAVAPRRYTSVDRGRSTRPRTKDDMSYGILVLRLVVGLTLAAHGAQKLFGWFGGGGLTGTGGFLEQLGFVPGRRAAL